MKTAFAAVASKPEVIIPSSATGALYAVMAFFESGRFTASMTAIGAALVVIYWLIKIWKEVRAANPEKPNSHLVDNMQRAWEGKGFLSKLWLNRKRKGD